MLGSPRLTPIATITSLCLMMASAPAMAQQVNEDLRNAPVPRPVIFTPWQRA